MIRAYFEMLLAEAEASQELPRAAQMGDPAGKMKQFASWFTHGVAGGAKLRAAIYHARTGAAVFDEVERFFSSRSAEELATEVSVDGAGPPLPDSALICD